MKFNPKALPITSKALFTIVGGAVLINPVFAQDQSADELEEVVVTGLRGSLKASMEIKRDATGVVDAISAEDIGKFPDTNLAESLQRITGVSIDRVNGEGSAITVRGFGPGFNLVTLNGRQLPAASRWHHHGQPHQRRRAGHLALLRLLHARLGRGERPRGVQDRQCCRALGRHRRDDQHQDPQAAGKRRTGHRLV